MRKLADEIIIVRLHSHGRRMILPAIWAILIVGVVTFFAVLLANNAFWEPVILLLGVFLILLASVVPWVRWRSTQYILTNQRAIVRVGLMRRQYIEILHSRCTGVQLTQSVGQRLRKSGDVSVGTEAGQYVRFVDVPDAQLVRDSWQQLVYAAIPTVSDQDYWAQTQL